MDYIRALQKKKNYGCIDNEPYKTNKSQDANSFLWTEPEGAVKRPFDYERYMDAAIQALNRAGIRMMDVSEAERKRAFLLESELTTAWNEGREADYKILVDTWKNIFLKGGSKR